ncbi:MAG: hypothetical protein JO189_17955 [Deltaproteobacteria bacterium]|nr:hypothetical protein [Deltaproteobacteria bacterium]
MRSLFASVYNAMGLFRRLSIGSEVTLTRLAAAVLASVIMLACGFLAGCTDASIARAQFEIAKGNYAVAHQYFATAAKKANALSPRERRQVMDGLCRTEYQIGPPSYPLAQQLHTCAAALNEPGSEDGVIFTELVRKERAAMTETINVALAQRDIASFDDTILRYRSLPGNDPEMVTKWTRQAWTIINREGEMAPGKAALAGTLLQLSRHLPNLHNMSDLQFRHWVERNMTVGGRTIVSNVEIGKRAIGLWLADDQINNATLNLDRFGRVNDGLVVRCRCNARTKVTLKESGLPAYLVRLDTADHQSEVLILYQPLTRSLPFGN